MVVNGDDDAELVVDDPDPEEATDCICRALLVLVSTEEAACTSNVHLLKFESTGRDLEEVRRKSFYSFQDNILLYLVD